MAGGAFGVANVPGGVSTDGDDALIQGESNGAFPGGFNHASCLNNPTNTNDGGSIEGN
jgi:hypothetical protein